MNELLERLEKTASSTYSVNKVANDLEGAKQKYDEAVNEFSAYKQPTLGATAGALTGLVGGATLGSLGPRGGVVPAAALSMLGGMTGAGVGTLLDSKRLNAKYPGREEAFNKYLDAAEEYENAQMATKTADETLMNRLEKTAEEAYPEEGRINRGFVAESLVGTGPIGYYAKKNNTLGVNEGDSHTAADAKLGALINGVGGGMYGAGMGALAAGGKGALAGGLAGAATSGLLGAGTGALIGSLHDKYDEKLRNEQEKEANETLMNRLEKTAAPLAAAGKKVKDFATNVSGVKGKKVDSVIARKEKAFNENQQKAYDPGTDPKQADALKEKGKKRLDTINNLKDTSKAYKAETSQARKQLATGAGLVGAGSLAGYHFANKEKTASEEIEEQEKIASNEVVTENQEKTASETFMSDLLKEAASQILEIQLPEVKVSEDPINKIKFSR